MWKKPTFSHQRLSLLRSCESHFPSGPCLASSRLTSSPVLGKLSDQHTLFHHTADWLAPGPSSLLGLECPVLELAHDTKHPISQQSLEGHQGQIDLTLLLDIHSGFLHLYSE